MFTLSLSKGEGMTGVSMALNLMPLRFRGNDEPPYEHP